MYFTDPKLGYYTVAGLKQYINKNKTKLYSSYKNTQIDLSVTG